MARQVDFMAENPLFQATDSALKDFDDAWNTIKKSNRHLAVQNFLQGMGEFNQPKDFGKKIERLKKTQEFLSRAPQSKDPMQMAAEMQARNAQVAAWMQEDQLEEQQRQAVKEEYVNRNLGLVAMMNDDEKAALSYAFPKIGSSLAAFASGGHGGGMGGIKMPEKEFKVFKMGGKDVAGAFDPTFETFTPIMSEMDPLVMSGVAHNYAQAEHARAAAGTSNAATLENLQQAEKYKQDGFDAWTKTQPVEIAGQTLSFARIPEGSNPDTYKQVQDAWNLKNEKGRFIGSQVVDTPFGKAYQKITFDPTAIKMTKGGGGGGGGKALTPAETETAENIRRMNVEQEQAVSRSIQLGKIVNKGYIGRNDPLPGNVTRNPDKDDASGRSDTFTYRHRNPDGKIETLNRMSARELYNAMLTDANEWRDKHSTKERPLKLAPYLPD